MNLFTFILISIATFVITAILGGFLGGNMAVLLGAAVGAVYSYLVLIPFLNRYI